MTTAVGADTAPSTALRSARSASLLALAMLMANVLAYVGTTALSRLLGPTEYGVLGPVLGLLVVLAVPGLALQQVVARRVAADDLLPGLLLPAVVGGAALSLVVLAAAPLLIAVLHLDAPVVVWGAVSLAPVPLASVTQGLLQGGERFGRLSGLFIGGAALRAGLPAVTVGLGGGVTEALIATALANACWAALGVAMVGGLAGGARAAQLREVAHETAAVVGVVGGLLLLANLDLLLARHYLPGPLAGAYAAGAIITRIAYWGPQFVAVAALPRLADPSRRRAALVVGSAAVASLAAVGVAVMALFAQVLVPTVLGDEYAALIPAAWRFALLGGLLSVAQFALTSGVAVRSRGLRMPIGVAATVQLVLTSLANDGLLDILNAAIASAATLVLMTLVGQFRRHTRPASGA